MMKFGEKNFFYQLIKPDFLYLSDRFVKQPRPGDEIEFSGKKFLVKKVELFQKEVILAIFAEEKK